MGKPRQHVLVEEMFVSLSPGPTAETPWDGAELEVGSLEGAELEVGLIDTLGNMVIVG